MPTVSVKNGNVILVSNKDFKVTYAQNDVVGTAKVTISGVGNYTGTVQKTFKIVFGKVAGLKQSGSKSSASATLTWTAVPGASGYEIYRATSKNSTYKKVKEQSAVTFRNTGLTGGSRYYYKIRAYKTVNGTKVYGAYSNVISAMTLPKTPKLKLEASASAITVKWDKISGCKGYELYMSTSKNGTYTRIKNANASTVSYKKSGLSSGKTYYFKVRSYITDASGKKVYSNYSTVVSGMRLPKAPSIRLTTSGKSVKVSWSKATGCKGYELYMSTSKNGTYSRIKSGNVTSYTKTGLVSGKTYYFKLRSYTKNAAGKNIYSSYGAVKSIKVK
jgi:fibronectin type 3 domain-containing protein